ncbi:MAG: hypothetical protein B7Y25_06575 [Alphaproteobacteria bacterium 16-39-46]|nr:MAG: hypothetical protein B7Y25_06575 [Alphaproteobacteria bacterium 16-39-46]OZA42260.1 MAG: hypothetical protein B7X84_06620 [Alphaproteobacteria bacterium 17-39-52]HQS84550.1 hypothetical protein [Alphaproteobacteria bacterium]HQS94339.1 hypothetical protein [Alphaproteobacteria bacterium]
MSFKYTIISVFLGILFGTTQPFKAQAVTWDEMTEEERSFSGSIFRRVKELTNSYNDLRLLGSHGLAFKTEAIFAVSRAEYFNGAFPTARTQFLTAFNTISEKQDLALCQHPGIAEIYRTGMIRNIEGLYGNIERIWPCSRIGPPIEKTT